MNYTIKRNIPDSVFFSVNLFFYAICPDSKLIVHLFVWVVDSA